MNDQTTKIISNEPVTGDVNRLRFSVDWKSYDPGQFVMISIPGDKVFLRRPFGIAGLDEGVAEICYKIVGKGTRALSETASGAVINVLGPCGRGFDISDADRTPVLVAGGYGIAPLMGLARSLVDAGRGVKLYYGGRRADDLFCTEELKSLGVDLITATEDGSSGEKGFVTEALLKGMSSIASPELFVCGPEGLIRAVAKIGIERDLPTQVSLDSYMACGIGVCLGCVCKDTDDHFVRVCKEGPVFLADELKWDI
jgi:dihydroorotate dehydrogenase electron transfer subunit